MNDRPEPARPRHALVLAILIVLLGGAVCAPSLFPGLGAAYADDDDGGGDDGDDDDGGNDQSGSAGRADRDDSDRRDSGSADRDADRVRPLRVIRNQNRAPAPATRRAPTVQAAPRPSFAAGEIVVTDLSEADLAQLLSEGFAVIERSDLTEVALVVHRLRVPAGLTLDAARDRVRAQPTGATGDFNHFYRSEEGAALPAPDLGGATAQRVALGAPAPCAHLNCASLDLIGWPAARDLSPQCRVTVPVGVIDTGVNAAHDHLAGADLEVLRLAPGDLDPSAAVHGTAVAALLVGQRPDRAPGLIPEAKLIAVDVFGRAGGDERATVVALVRALDLLAARGVKVINMSLAGPANAALEAALVRLAEPGGAVVLAAAGNGGPGAEAAYPAAYPSVLAVTAVDRRGQVYRRAQRGPYLDLAAPGVDIWTATSIRGVKSKTGTSFAVPFATAAAAILASQDPGASPGAIADRLRAEVRDIGAAGRDEVFGSGLLALDRLCAPATVTAPTE